MQTIGSSAAEPISRGRSQSPGSRAPAPEPEDEPISGLAAERKASRRELGRRISGGTEALERAARAIEPQFDYYGPFGFGAVVARLGEPMFDLNKKVTAQMLREREIAIHGSKQYVIDTIMKMRKECGYDDFCFLGWFELGGFEAKEIEEQMQIFAEEVMPVIASECGGKVELPARGLDLAA